MGAEDLFPGCESMGFEGRTVIQEPNPLGYRRVETN